MTRMSQTCFLRLFFILDAEFKLKLIIFKTGILVSASGRIATSYFFAVCREDLGEILSSFENVPFAFLRSTCFPNFQATKHQQNMQIYSARTLECGHLMRF